LSSKQTKHIKAKYFLIKDYYDAGEIDVKFCPTDEIWANVLTKPLQGRKFRDMRDFLQNCPWDYDDDTELKISMKPQGIASLQECVDEHAKLKTKLKTKPQANHKPQAPHEWHESHGDQHKSRGSVTSYIGWYVVSILHDQPACNINLKWPVELR